MSQNESCWGNNESTNTMRLQLRSHSGALERIVGCDAGVFPQQPSFCSQAEKRLSRFLKGKLSPTTTFSGAKQEENPEERMINSKESTVDEEWCDLDEKHFYKDETRYTSSVLTPPTPKKSAIATVEGEEVGHFQDKMIDR